MEYLEKSPDAVTTILPTEEPEHSLSMGYEHLSTTPETELDKVTESSSMNLLPIPSEYEVTFKDKNECDVLVCEDSSTFDVCDNHSEILSDSTNDDDISSDEDAFEDIEYVEASPIDSELVSLEEENDVHQEEEKSSASFPIFEESDNSLSFLDNSLPEFETFSDQTEETRSGRTTTHDSLPEYDSFCFEIEPNQERLTSVIKNDISDDSLNDSLLEEIDLFLASDNSIPPGIENFDYDSTGDIRFLKELLIDDSILFPDNKASDHDNPSFPRPPPEPPDDEFDFEPNSGEVISAVMNNNDELNEDNCFDPGGEINDFANVEDDDYFPFTFVI
nr:hypothetical protein [Tanacetum cinerariifolium]